MNIIYFLAAVASILSWALTMFYNKELMKNITPIELTVNRWVLGGLIGIICMLFLHFNKGNLLTGTELSYRFDENKKYYGIITLMLIGSFIGSATYYFLIDKVGASTVAMYLNPLNILVVALLGHFFFDEKFNKQMIAGMGTITIGMLIFAFGNTKKLN